MTGLVERVTFHSEESGFSVLRVAVRGHRNLCTVVGTLPAVSEGEWLSATGRWTIDAKHGQQFRAEQVRTSAPDTAEGIERYLASGLIRGIGPTLAARLVAAFNKEVFSVIDASPERLREVDGIGSMRQKAIAEAFHAQKVVREIMVFLHSHGVSSARAYRIFKTYGEVAIEKVQADPYCLARDIRGIGFKTADQIAAKLGVGAQSDLRARAGVEFALQELTNDGHCAFSRDGLIRKVSEVLGIPVEITRAAVDFVIAHEIGHLKAGHLRFRPLLLPGRLFPFLGSAWSRACEYTADRYGFAGIADVAAATHGLAVLAAGGAYSRKVNVPAFVGQRGAMNTVFMTLGSWMSSHPPLASRVAELDRTRFPRRPTAAGPVLGALGVVALIFLIPVVVGVVFARSFVKNARRAAAGQLASPVETILPTESSQLDPAKARQLVADIRKLNSFAEDYRRRTGVLPRSVDELYREYERSNPGLSAPLDPYTGRPYAYEVHGSSFRIWSPS